MDELVTSKADWLANGRRRAAKLRNPNGASAPDGRLVSAMANEIFTLVNDKDGKPVNYEMVDATVRNHKIKVKGANGKPELVPVPAEKMVTKVTMPDGTVVDRPRYGRLVAIPKVVVRDANNITIDELCDAVRQLADLIDQYDASERIQAPNLPDGKAGRNVKRVALISSKPGGKVEMPTASYLWSAICGAIRLDTQQNGQAVMRAKINEEMPIELGLEKPDGRVRSTKATPVTSVDQFSRMADE